MGYYVDIVDHDIHIKKENFEAIYKLMCELNDHDELKRGGTHPRNEKYTTRYNPNVWFSWMDYNYPETCSNLEEILGQIGFDINKNNDGDIIGLGYSNKVGNEDYFLACFAGFVPDGSYIEFSGEETEDFYRYYYTDGKCFYQKGSMVISYDSYQEELIPGQITESDKAHQIWLENWRKKQSELDA